MPTRNAIAIGTGLLLVVGAVSMGLLLAGPLRQTDGTTVAETSDTDAATLIAATSPGTASEGIQVHGDWVIEVRDPDGTLVTHREFRNALEGFGDDALADFLGRQTSVGLWQVGLHALTGDNPCENSSSSENSCIVVESANDDTGPQYFKTLTVTSNSGQLILSPNPPKDGVRTAEGGG